VNGLEVDQLSPLSKSYLRTSMIDCTQKGNVFIRFNTYIHSVVTNPSVNAVLKVRAGNGSWRTYTIFPSMNAATLESLQGYNGQTVQINISDAAANKADVQIEWSWTNKGDVVCRAVQ
jgi:hypothetical protein